MSRLGGILAATGLTLAALSAFAQDDGHMMNQGGEHMMTEGDHGKGMMDGSHMMGDKDRGMMDDNDRDQGMMSDDHRGNGMMGKDQDSSSQGGQ